MSDETIDSRSPTQRPVTYEPPKVTPLGNVRDLLAGSIGTGADAGPPDPENPNHT